MAKLTYSTITSLDGFVADESGDFTWGMPDPEVSDFINEVEQGVGTVLYGRRLYETMVYWETFGDAEDDSADSREFAEQWRVQNKIVYSTTLKAPSSARTTIEHSFVPDAVQRLKDSSPTDLSIGGPHLASQAIEARLVDEMHLYVAPVTLGGGTPAHPGEARSGLELIDVRRFESGFVHLHYNFNN